MPDHEWASRASHNLGVPLRYHASDEYAGPCPRCGGRDKRDANRFIVFREGNAWCRKCGYKTVWDRDPDAKIRAGEFKQKRTEDGRRLRATMATNTDWIAFHDRAKLNGAGAAFEAQGLTMVDVAKYGLGFCESCPTAPDYKSLTFPVTYQGVLQDIRHRLIDAPPEAGKYRSHRAGIIPFPYNLDAMYQTQNVLVVEGEKKPIVLARYGFHAVGVPGVNLTADLLEAFQDIQPFQTVTIMFDPGATKPAESLATDVAAMGIQTYVADAFDKPDDLVVEYGETVLQAIVDQARRWK